MHKALTGSSYNTRDVNRFYLHRGAIYIFQNPKSFNKSRPRQSFPFPITQTI